MSLAGQVMAVASACILVTATAALILIARWRAVGLLKGEAGALAQLELIGGLAAAAIASIGVVMCTVRRMILRPMQRLEQNLAHVADNHLDGVQSVAMPSKDLAQLQTTFDRMVTQLRTVRGHFEEAQRVLATRTSTVDRLLDFSQTIQGAGTSGMVFTSLCHFLHNELSLAGMVIVTYEPEQTPTMHVRAAWPAEMVDGVAVSNLDHAACPCLRQHLPKSFRVGGSPVRCAIDACLKLGPEHPAYCIPFSVGRKTQVVVHMLLPTDQTWTEERKQVAQTYVNSASSSLTSLHLLEEAERQSMTDVLTGLFNRRSMESLLLREVALSERHNHALSLVMIDMDHFKEINDAHGHAAGDHMLKAFADCVRITLRKTDLAFRYGGDEFVIALPQTPVAQAVQVVHKLRQAFGAVDFSHAIAHLDHPPTLSIGVVERMVGQNIITLQNLLSAADQALYEAKSANRNCVKIYQPQPQPTKAA